MSFFNLYFMFHFPSDVIFTSELLISLISFSLLLSIHIGDFVMHLTIHVVFPAFKDSRFASFR